MRAQKERIWLGVEIAGRKLSRHRPVRPAGDENLLAAADDEVE